MIQIEGNLIEDCWGTVAIVTKYVGTIDTIISNNIIRNSTTVGISIESEDGTASEYADKIVVANNVITDLDYAHSSGFSNISYGISVTEQARKIVISGNVVDLVAASTLGAGIVVSTAPTQGDTEVRLVTISGNTVSRISASSGRGHCVLISTGDTAIEGLSITGNTLDDADSGITFDTAVGAATTGGVIDVSVIGNVITNIAETGIWCNLLSSSGDVALTRALINSNVISAPVRSECLCTSPTR
jgi:hypothetical protein